MFWPDSPDDSALANLRRSLKNLRHVLGPDSYRITSPGLRTVGLDLAGVSVDVLEFDAAMAGDEADPVERALELVFGYAAGVDLTRRDLQNVAKDAGSPWDSSKGFDASAPCSAIRPASTPPTGAIRISVNGAVKQNGELADMIWSVAEIIAKCSELWTLQPGDLIFTGTPDGVGPLVRGDRVVGEIEGAGQLEFTVS